MAGLCFLEGQMKGLQSFIVKECTSKESSRQIRFCQPNYKIGGGGTNRKVFCTHIMIFQLDSDPKPHPKKYGFIFPFKKTLKS